jgi:hypothetical protein
MSSVAIRSLQMERNLATEYLKTIRRRKGYIHIFFSKEVHTVHGGRRGLPFSLWQWFDPSQNRCFWSHSKMTSCLAFLDSTMCFDSTLVILWHI